MSPRSNPVRHDVLQGLRILLVEDEMLIAIEMAMLLEGAGCVVVGPAPRVPAALALVRENRIDGAILDMNLAGKVTFEIADALAEQQTPFIFVTGYGEHQLPPRFSDRPVLDKPVMAEALLASMSSEFAAPVTPDGAEPG